MAGVLQPLWDYLAKEDLVVDGEKDRKQSDLALARLLSTDDFAGAITAASFDDLDRALAHDALAVERKPLSCLFLLSTKSSKVEQVARRSEDTGALRTAAQRLILQVSQFLYQVPVYVVVKEMKRLSHLSAHYANLALELGQPIKAVFPLKSLLRRFHQHGHAVVTPLHAHFYYLCLQAKCYSAATEILNQPLFEVYSEQKVATAVDFLGYAYYGGVLCVGQKQYQLAIEYLLSAVTAPAISLSAFVVEAYKKLVLASLIWYGETPSLPKYTPFVVSRHLEMHCSAYVELGRAFTIEKDLEKVALVAQTHAALFAKDGNFGLVKQVIEALKQRKLLQLPRTYVTIALSEMTKAVGMENHGDVAAEKLLLQLIARGDMAAVVDKQKQMVKFVLDDDAASSAESDLEQMRVMEKLQREMEKILYVSAQLRAMDTDIVTSAKFQHRLQKEKERRQQRAGHGGGPASALDERMFPDAMD